MEGWIWPTGLVFATCALKLLTSGEGDELKEMFSFKWAKLRAFVESPEDLVKAADCVSVGLGWALESAFLMEVFRSTLWEMLAWVKEK